ncbi:MAG: hypothetical protein WC453_01560 [Patescibacteria group bacterium]
MAKKYTLTPAVWLIRDEAGVKFHIQNDDYFGTIATILHLIKHNIKKDGLTNAAVLKKTLYNMESDLLFLQKNYRITPRLHSKPRTRNKKTSPKGRLKSQ